MPLDIKPVPTVAQRIATIMPYPLDPLPPPLYLRSDNRGRAMLAVETFSRHMTDEGWQLQLGLQAAGYALCGRYFDFDETDTRQIVRDLSPGIVIVQDKREWDSTNAACFDKSITFQNTESLADDPTIFKLTVCKDAHQQPRYHVAASAEIGCHAWIAYYHPDMVCHLAPWIRRKHVVRTWHSIDPAAVPPYSPDGRQICILSGASNQALYPLRERLKRNLWALPPGTAYLQHPGYHARGSHTPAFLKTLSGYKVAICTSSKFGYALRKIMESSACGCAVVTDLPPDDVLPEIDGNLIRVSPDSTPHEISAAVQRAADEYDHARQREFAERAIEFYNYRRRGLELSAAIEAMRESYAAP